MAEKQQSFDSQKQRWLKYGTNVAVATLVVIALAVIFVYLAHQTGRRIDTTEARQYSLKPQTINILNDAKGKTKLVSLYRDEIRGKGGKMIKSPYADPVADLLNEYRRKSNKVEVEVIDPVDQDEKVKSLIEEVTAKYSGEVSKYKKVTDAYKETYEKLKKIAGEETAAASKLPVDQLTASESAQNVALALDYLPKIPRDLQRSDSEITDLLADKPPDYKAAVDEVQTRMQSLTKASNEVLEIFVRAKDQENIPQPVRAYIPRGITAFEQIKKLAEELEKQTQDLGELKLDDLRRSLDARDVILVMGESDLRVIPFEQVWKVDDAELKQLAPGQEIKPHFAGEQQVSTAIHALASGKKPRVVFVRNGGSPMTTPGMFPFRRGGPMSNVGERLRQYNFEVLEKDLTGMWEMQAMRQQMPSEPEATEEQMKDAIWVVLALPNQQPNPMMQMPTPTMSPQVGEHLKNGGSAMIIYWPQVDSMNDVLKGWGIEARPDTVAVHQLIAPTEGRQGDQIDEAQRHPAVFSIRDYGDHAITRPLRSLESWLAPILPVKVSEASGVKTTPIIPIPAEPQSWGESDIDGVFQLGEIKFDEKTDISHPIYGGAVAESEKGNRLVVIGSPTFALDRFIREPDPEMLERGWDVARFPANADLFANSMFWLAKMEPMIAISPSAMQVSRIQPMSKGALSTWRNGVLLILLPGVIVLAGVGVWFARRD